MQSTPKQVPENDVKLFQQLDQYSKEMRGAGNELKEYFVKVNTNSSSKEVSHVIETLQKLKDAEVSSLDDVIWELNQDLNRITVKINEDKFLAKAIAKASIEEYYEKANAFVQETQIFLGKITELNQH